MKKLFIVLALSIISINLSFAQIGNLAPKEQTLEIKRALKNVSIVYDKQDNTYCLMIESDNQYEEKFALLLLGTGAKEALSSLVNLNNALKTPNETFEVQNYTISTFVTTTTKKNYGLVNTVGPLEYAAGSYIFEEEGLGNAMLILIDRIEDFDYSDAIVTTTEVWGDAKSSIGITGLMCDFYLPSLGVHFVGGPDKYDYKTDSKKYTKLMTGLTSLNTPWGPEQYKIVVNGLDNHMIKLHRPLFEKICRLKAQ